MSIRGEARQRETQIENSWRRVFEEIREESLQKEKNGETERVIFLVMACRSFL